MAATANTVFGMAIGHDAAGDVDVAAGQGKGVHVLRVQQGEVNHQVGAMALACQFFADTADVGL